MKMRKRMTRKMLGATWFSVIGTAAHRYELGPLRLTISDGSRQHPAGVAVGLQLSIWVSGDDLPSALAALGGRLLTVFRPLTDLKEPNP